MKKEIIKLLSGIINTDLPLSEKRRQLYEQKRIRRGVNKEVISVITDILTDHYLPIHFGQDLQISSVDILSNQGYDVLRVLVQSCTFNYFNAVSYEILWKHYHKIEYAKQAISFYNESLKTVADNYQAAAMVAAICRIFAKTRQSSIDMASFQDFCVNSVISQLEIDNGLVSTILNNIMMVSPTPKLEQHISDTIRYHEANQDYQQAIDFARILIDAYSKAKKDADKQLWLCKTAQYLEKQADQYDWQKAGNSRTIIHLIQRAMRTWSISKHPNATNERNRLAKRIEPVKKLSLETIQTIMTEKHDLTDVINLMRSNVEQSSFERNIWSFVTFISLTDPNTIEKRLHNSNYVLSTLFSTKILDKNGRIKCIVPALFNASIEEKISIYEHEAEFEYSINADALVTRYLHIMKEEYTFSEENLHFLVDDNAFIPEDRKKSFLKGLVAGFNLDFITSMSILMPQMENAIRRLAETCGAVVYITEDNGVEKCLSLDSILKRPEIVDSLDEVLIFNLKVFLTSDYGFGMRNNICHSFMSDDEFNSPASLIAWWFTLRLCCIFSPELHRRLSEETTNSLD